MAKTALLPASRRAETNGVAQLPAFRIAVEADAPAYRDLRLEALREHPDAFLGDYGELRAVPPEFWSRELASRSGRKGATIVVEVGGRLIGTASIRRFAGDKYCHSATINDVYMRADHRREGLGRGLLVACLRWAQFAGVRIVRLCVLSSNTAAISLYEQLGFKTFGTDPDAVRIGRRYRDQFRMAKRLRATTKRIRQRDRSPGSSLTLGA
jgi:RimJ/RimL family protein N-acetyltransferase